MSKDAALGEKIVIQPRLADFLEDDKIVLSKRSTRYSCSAIPAFARSISFDAQFQGLSITVFDGIITDIASVEDTISSNPGTETIILVSGEAFVKIDVFEGESGLAIKVSITQGSQASTNSF